MRMNFSDAHTIWVLVAWLIPLWWALALLVLASLADRFPELRDLAWRFFERLERTPAVP